MKKLIMLLTLILSSISVLAINEGEIFFGDSGAAGASNFPGNLTIETIYFLQGVTVGGIIAAVVENFNHYLYMFLVFVPLALILLGIKGDNPWFIMLAGILLSTFAVALYANKFPNLSFETNLLTTAFAIFILGLGLYVLGKITIELAGEAGR